MDKEHPTSRQSDFRMREKSYTSKKFPSISVTRTKTTNDSELITISFGNSTIRSDNISDNEPRMRELARIIVEACDDNFEISEIVQKFYVI